jgi:hypothetical protein
MSMKKEIEKEENAHQSMKWDEMKTGGGEDGEKNVGQVDGTGPDVEPEAQSVGTNGSVGGDAGSE